MPPVSGARPDRSHAPAIVGIGVRLPGGICGPQALWQALLEGRDAITEYSDQRWDDLLGQLSVEQRPARKWPAGVIDIEAFDHDFFGLTATEAAEMDPQQRFLLETVIEALADAGIAPGSLAGTRTGVYVGASSFDHAITRFGERDRVTMQTMAGTAMAILANRVSYVLDLRGPSMSIDTACSSSMSAIHLACRDIADHDVDTAIVAGVGLLKSAGMTATFVEGGVMASSERVRPFDAGGDGYVRAEGAGVLVLKRREDARASRHRVYATVLSTTANSDGRSLGLFAPNPEAQADMLRTACARAGVDPRDVDYVQAHGTATAAGDRVEAKALSEVLGAGRAPDDPLLVGSVKSNVGHLEAGAGVIGVITAALALHHATIPPTINHDRIRPNLARLPLRVPTQVLPWPKRAQGRPRIAGASAFGFGGSNAHTLLESADDSARAEPAPVTEHSSSRLPSGRVLFPICAHSPSSLRATAEAWAPVVAKAGRLDQVASTALHRRDHGPALTTPRTRHRAVILAGAPEEAAEALEALAAGRSHPALRGPHTIGARPSRLVWVFSGHGSHWSGMGRRLSHEIPVFAEAVEDVRRALSDELGHPSWKPGEALDGFATIQHAIFTVQVALARTWLSWGLRPDAVIGHSVGEVAAAHVAGALSLSDATRLLRVRSELVARTAGQGGLLATELSPEQVREVISGQGDVLALAVDNGPRSTVVSGPEEALAELHARLEREGVWARPVADGVPAHGPFLEPMMPRMRDALEGFSPTETEIPFYSTLTAQAESGTNLDADYWARQMRSTVRLREAVVTAMGKRPTTLLEISPRTVLGVPLAQTLTAHALTGDVVSAGRADGDEVEQTLVAAAELSLYGHTPAGTVTEDLPPVPLPPVAWDRGQATGVWSETSRDHAALLAQAEGPRERRQVLMDLLREIAGDILRRDPAEIPLDEEIGFLGISSVALIQVRDRLREVHPGLASLPVAVIYTDPTIAELAERIDGHLEGRMEDGRG
ncbi:hypothetical protein GCM10027294_22820 [Marinactinospora endophytica]